MKRIIFILALVAAFAFESKAQKLSLIHILTLPTNSLV